MNAERGGDCGKNKNSGLKFRPASNFKLFQNQRALPQVKVPNLLLTEAIIYKAATSLSVKLKYRIISLSLCCISSKIGSDIALYCEGL